MRSGRLTYLEGAAIIDLKTHLLTFLDLTRDNMPYGSYNWVWATDGQSLYIIRTGNELIQVDLAGNLQPIAQNVAAIYAYSADD